MASVLFSSGRIVILSEAKNLTRQGRIIRFAQHDLVIEPVILGLTAWLSSGDLAANGG
jgi:hypothetical protein